MARNGAGTYNLPIGNPVTTGTTISSTWANNTLTDIATALTGSISSDGQTTPTGNLPMGGYAHTGVANATIRTMYASAGQVQDSAFTFLTSISGADVITAVAAIGMSAYVTGQRFSFVAAGANTGACTLNINAIGAKAITKNGTTALTANDILSGSVVQVIYDGTQFQITNPANLIPAGLISMWSGSIATIPVGWYLCNGSNGTPDLRNQFIIGAYSDDAGVAKTTITGSATKSGGSKDAIVVSHNHTLTDPGHTHNQRNTGADVDTGSLSAGPYTSGSTYGPYTANTTTATASATTGITLADAGSSGTNANLVPYYALAFIMKA